VAFAWAKEARRQLQLALDEGLSDAEKRTLLRELQRRYHPDKNREAHKAAATAVFHYVSSCGDFFLQQS